MFKSNYIVLLVLFAIFSIMGCKDEVVEPEIVVFDETPYDLEYGWLPAPRLPEDNPLTIQGVKLGRMLFYEKMLSKDGSQNCASCHIQTDGFSDKRQFSIGVENLEGRRQAMPIFNMAWNNNEFFWDGRAHLLRDQSLMPIEDPLELNETLENVVNKLSASKMYTDQFFRAFGSEEITAEKMSLAMEQFMLSIVSADSKYDRYLLGEVELSPSEERGRVLFEQEYNEFFPEQSGADCTHCHGGLNFRIDRYFNNGLDTDLTLTDIGRQEATLDPNDKGKFKVPSLRNIAVTGPYMHDGRFETLDEVLDHYNAGIKNSSTLDPIVELTMETGLFLSAQEKADLIDFLETLTDENFLNNEAYQSPF